MLEAQEQDLAQEPLSPEQVSPEVVKKSGVQIASEVVLYLYTFVMCLKAHYKVGSNQLNKLMKAQL